MDARETTEIRAERLLETLLDIKKHKNKQRKDEIILGNLRDNSLYPNNFIDKAISQ